MVVCSMVLWSDLHRRLKILIGEQWNRLLSGLLGTVEVFLSSKMSRWL